MLLDPFNRRLNYLRLSLTDRCNLRCLYCMPEGGVPKLAHGDILSYEEFLRLARLSVGLGIEKIRLTGGEPLARKGVIPFITELARIPGIKDISLTTNGVLLAEQAQAIWEAGIRRINISLDSLDPGRYAQITRQDLFHQVWQGILAAEAVGFQPIKINVVALKGINEDEIPAFGRLSLEKPYHVRFIEFMPVGPETGCQEERYLPGNQILDPTANPGRPGALKRTGIGRSGPTLEVFRGPGRNRADQPHQPSFLPVLQPPAINRRREAPNLYFFRR